MNLSTKDNVWNHTLQILFSGENFDHLNVQDICQKSTIHRSTFYRLFDDKYALLEYGIDKLWNDYFSSHAFGMIITPFKFSSDFFSNSVAKTLIIAQQNNPQFLKTLKKYILSSYESTLKYFINQDQDFVAAYLVNTIDFIDTWNETLVKKMSIEQCDEKYLELVHDVLDNYITIH